MNVGAALVADAESTKAIGRTFLHSLDPKQTATQ